METNSPMPQFSFANILHTLLNKCNIKAAIFSGDLSDGRRQKLLETFDFICSFCCLILSNN